MPDFIIQPPAAPALHQLDLATPLDAACDDAFRSGTFSAPQALCESVSCAYSSTLDSAMCSLTDALLDPWEIKVASGGEEVLKVMHRMLADGLPSFSPHALQVQCDAPSPLPSPVEAVTPVPPSQPFTCADQRPEDHTVLWELAPTIALHRSTAHRLRETLGVVWLAWLSTHVFDLAAPARVLFLDGHTRSFLDEAWLHLFSPLEQAFDAATPPPLPYASILKQPICFRQLIVLPPWKAAALLQPHFQSTSLPYLPFCEPPTPALHRFVADVTSRTPPPPDDDAVRIVVVRREPFLEHPGLDPDRVTNFPLRLTNIDTLDLALRRADPRIRVAVVLLERYLFSSQVDLFHRADIVIGMPGAGLSHVLWMRPDTLLLQLTPSRTPDSFGEFAHLARLRGVHFTRVDAYASGQGTFYVDEERVVSTVAEWICFIRRYSLAPAPAPAPPSHAPAPPFPARGRAAS